MDTNQRVIFVFTTKLDMVIVFAVFAVLALTGGGDSARTQTQNGTATILKEPKHICEAVESNSTHAGVLTLTSNIRKINSSTRQLFLSCSVIVALDAPVVAFCVGNTSIKLVSRSESETTRTPSIQCRSSNLIRIQFEYLDSEHRRGSPPVYGDTHVPTQRSYTPLDSAGVKSEYFMSIQLETQTSVRYTVEGVLEGDHGGRLETWTADTPITILALYKYKEFRKPVGIWTPTPTPVSLRAHEDPLLIPCLTLTRPDDESDPVLYRKSDPCGYRPELEYDPMRGLQYQPEMSLGTFLCCPAQVNCSSLSLMTNCAEFRIEDSPDIVATPTMPSSGPLRLFTSKEDNSIPFRLECSASAPKVQLRGVLHTNLPDVDYISGWLDFLEFFSSTTPTPIQHSWNLTASNYTLKQTRDGVRAHIQATYETTLRIFDTLEVECLNGATGEVLYTWNIKGHNAGPLQTDRGHLKLLMEPFRQPGSAYYPELQRMHGLSEAEEAPILQCFSLVHTDARLRVIRCHNPAQCRLLEWCLESETNQCGSLVSEGTECLVEAQGTKSCQEAPAPSPGALYRCTAGPYAYTQLRWTSLNGKNSYQYKEDDFWQADLQREMFSLVAGPNTRGQPNDVYYTRLTYNFSCVLHPFWSAGRVRFLLGSGANNTHDSPAKARTVFDEYSPSIADFYAETTELVITTTKVNRILCIAPKTGRESAWIAAGLPLNVVESAQPVILNQQTGIHFADDEIPKTIECQVLGLPIPSVVWFRRSNVDGTEYRIKASESGPVHVVPDLTSVLQFDRFTKELEGIYTCKAGNEVGNDAVMDFSVSLPPRVPWRGNLTWTFVAGGAGVLLVLLMGLIVLMRCLGFPRKRIVDQIEMDKILYGTDIVGSAKEQNAQVEPPRQRADADLSQVNEVELKLVIHAEEDSCRPSSSWVAVIEQKPFAESFKINRRTFTIDKKRKLGEGEYGRVYAGTWQPSPEEPPLPVGIKVPRKGCPEAILLGLLREVKIMTNLQHENLVRLVGACIKDAAYGKLYILMEFCEEGSLEQFFERKKCYYVDRVKTKAKDKRISPAQTKSAHYVQFFSFGFSELLRWCAEVAAGMEFLSQRGVVHRDLAARNVLLTRGSLRAKVSDFGLSRQLYGRLTYEQQTLDMKLPFRWMAVECFEGRFSTHSDVWAYGVLAWEIFSLGELPYTGLEFKEVAQFADLLRRGMRITEKHRATNKIYSKLKECWHENPEKRPTFTQLRNFFTNQ